MNKKIFIFLSVLCIIVMISSVFTGKYLSRNIQPEKEVKTEVSSVPAEKIVFGNNFRLRGSIFDRRGHEFSYTVYENSPVQKYKREFCKRPDSKKYSLPFSNLIDGYTPSNEGLDLVYEKILREKNITDTTDDAIGKSVQLTVDAELSYDIYKMLSEYEDTDIFSSSVFIMRPDGEVLTMLSTPVFDLESYKTSLWERVSYTESPAVVNSCRHSVNIGSDFFSKISEIYYNDTPDSVGYNKLNKLLNEHFCFDFGTTDEKYFGHLDKNSFVLNESKQLQTSLTPVYLAEFMSLCTTGKMYKARILKNEVDTNDFNNTINSYDSKECIADIPENKKNALCEAYGTVCSEYDFDIKNGYTLYGDLLSYNEMNFFAGGYINNFSVDDSFIIVLRVDTQTSDMLNTRYDMLVLFNNIITLLNSEESAQF